MSGLNGHSNGAPKKNGKKTGYRCPPVEHQFKKGHPGGPGRPKGTGITDKLREMLASPDALNKFCNAAVRASKKGHFQFWNAVLERLEGKVANENKNELDATLTVRFADEASVKAGRMHSIIDG